MRVVMLTNARAFGSSCSPGPLASEGNVDCPGRAMRSGRDAAIGAADGRRLGAATDRRVAGSRATSGRTIGKSKKNPALRPNRFVGIARYGCVRSLGIDV